MLEKIEIFKDLKAEDLQKLEQNIKTEKFKKRQTIFNEGDDADKLYVLLSGKVKISKTSPEGKEIVLEIIDAVDVFGALAVIKGFPYPANAIAMENSLVGKIPKSVFMEIFNKYPELGNKILFHITMRLKSGIETLKNVALQDVKARIIYHLLRFATKYGKKTPDGVLIDLKITKQDLAELAATSVETAIRVMSRLKKDGYITENNKKIVIKNIEALSAMIGELI